MATYKLIQTISAPSGSVANFDFTSIPTDGTYNDLVLKIHARSTAASNTENIAMTLNGSTSGYNVCYMFHNGYTGGGFNAGGLDTNYHGGWINGNNCTANAFGLSTVYINNYISSSTKTFTCDSVQANYATGTNTQYQGMWSEVWSGTAAINRITLTPSSGNFAQYSIASLYGIKSV